MTMASVQPLLLFLKIRGGWTLIAETLVIGLVVGTELGEVVCAVFPSYLSSISCSLSNTSTVSRE